MFICTDGDNAYASGDTLEEAFANYKSDVGDDVNVDDLEFYQAEGPLEVEVKLVCKCTPVKKTK